MAGLWQRHLVSCCSWWGWGRAKLVQPGAAEHAGAFSRGLAPQGMWCQRNVLPAKPETLGLIQPEKQGGLWQRHDPCIRGWAHGGCSLPFGLGEPGPEQWSCVLRGWGGSSIPQEPRTSGEGTVGRLGLVSQYILPLSMAPLPLQSELDSGYGEMGFHFNTLGLEGALPSLLHPAAWHSCHCRC